MVSVNLIPETVRFAQTRRRHIRRWLVSILSAVVILAVPLTIDWMQRAEAAELAERRIKLEVELATTRSEVETLTAQANEARSRLERAIALQAKRPWSAMFAMIEQCMPEGCWLISVATDPPTPHGARSTPKAPGPDAESEEQAAVVVIDAPRKLAIAGYAVDAADPHTFVRNLKGTEVFTNVTLQHVRREPVGRRSCLRFDLVCEW